MDGSTLQNSLFEEDYLLRELGQVAHVPHVALTELVANAWDAGAFRVDITIPEKIGDVLCVEDDGHGMTAAQFSKRWMMLRYARLKHQSGDVEFPKTRSGRKRKAYGRNGIGRHGLLCFGDEYQVETWRDGELGKFVVSTQYGSSPFVLKNQYVSTAKEGHGTRLTVKVERSLPDKDEILNVLAARFVHDPEFEIRVNGIIRQIQDIDGIIWKKNVEIDDDKSLTVIVIDSTKASHSSVHQGIAFWVGHRLVGTPSWSVGSVHSFDGRTRFARRYKVIVDTQGFELEVEPDWTDFKKSEAVQTLFKATVGCIKEATESIVADIIEESSEDALDENRDELEKLGLGARQEVVQFTKEIVKSNPMASPEFIATAVKAVINLEKSKNGMALLQKLSTFEVDDIENLDRLLDEWSLKDALRVLDEIDNRLKVIETIDRISGDSSTDELHTLHPLILQSRWLFGAEFESDEYCSNSTLKKVAEELFGKVGVDFQNPRKRPDIVVLPDKTSSIQLMCIEQLDISDPSSVAQIKHILLIELKKGGFSIGRKEVSQADGYIQDIAESAFITGSSPYIYAWVVGDSIEKGVGSQRKFRDDDNNEYGHLRVTTFGQLVSTANLRLMKLRTRLQERYQDIPTDALLEKVLSKPYQMGVGKLNSMVNH